MESLKTRKSAIVIGTFDGFHLGHQKLISVLKLISDRENLQSVILTFDPNPKVFLKLGKNLIHSSRQRKEFLASQNIDRVVILDFRQVSNLSGEEFVIRYLVERLNVGYLVVGENFRFGKNRSGSVALFREMGTQFGFRTEIMRSEKIGAIRISSTHIRALLAEGNIELANQLLGYQYSIWGRIGEGDKLGRELGYPTINILTDNSILPEGVFKTRVEFENKSFQSATYIGLRPTFNGKEKRIESHILEFAGILYNKDVRVFFERKIRDEVRFESRDGLIRQIQKDVELVKVDKN